MKTLRIAASQYRKFGASAAEVATAFQALGQPFRALSLQMRWPEKSGEPETAAK